jgi:hypothetical protein
MLTPFKLTKVEKQTLVAIKDLTNSKPSLVMEYLSLNEEIFSTCLLKLRILKLVYTTNNLLKQELLSCTHEGGKLASSYIEKHLNMRPEKFSIWVAQPIKTINAYSRSSFSGSRGGRVGGHL